MAIDALGTPVLVSACRTIASTFSRRAAEIGAGPWVSRKEAASKITSKTRRQKRKQTAGRFPRRGSRFMHDSSETGTVYGIGLAFCRVTACAWFADGYRWQAGLEG